MEQLPNKIVDLNAYDRSRHRPGAKIVKRALWYGINALVFDSWWLPFYGLKRQLLRIFGATVGDGVVIKPRVRIKYPWKLSLGDYCWIGEAVWIDNIEAVRIGAHCCVSQGAYLCTGNHDWSDPSFGLILRPIAVQDQAWLGAFSVVSPGIVIAQGSVITAGSVVTKDTIPWMIYSGNPAQAVRKRKLFETAPVHEHDGRRTVSSETEIF